MNYSILDEMHRMFGKEIVDCLSDSLGGQTVMIPRNPGGETFAALVDAIGENRASQLVAMAGGDRLYIPARPAVAIDRDALIKKRAEKGESLREISRSLVYEKRLSHRQIQRIAAREKRK